MAWAESRGMDKTDPQYEDMKEFIAMVKREAAEFYSKIEMRRYVAMNSGHSCRSIRQAG